MNRNPVAAPPAGQAPRAHPPRAGAQRLRRLGGGPRVSLLTVLTGTLLAGAVLAGSLFAGTAAPASADTATGRLATDNSDQVYRYWGYYHLTDGQWAYAETGPAQHTPADGAVDGWRFALAAGSPTRTPRDTPSFAQICADTPAQDAKKRVAVVIDSGRAVDRASDDEQIPNPRAHCAILDTIANSAQVLATVASLAQGDTGLVCAINGYPRAGCTDPVAAADVPNAAAEPDDTLDISTAAADGSPAAVATATAATDAAATDAADAPAPSEPGNGALPWLVGGGLLAAVIALVATRYRQSQAG